VKKEPQKKPPKKPKRRQRFLPLAIGTTGSVALAAVAFWFFKKQAEEVVAGRADRFDERVLDVVHTIDNPPMHEAMHAITQLGTHYAIGAAAGVTALMMWRQGRRADAWTVVVSTGGAMAINTILKNIFQRQRPIERARRITLPNSHSFPSGHSLLSAATYPIVAHHLVQNRSVATQAVVHTLSTLTILSIGFSRVYFGVHFPSDVLGGLAAGYGWLGLTSLSHVLMEAGREVGAKDEG
jgi:PAP2 superfamily